MTISDEVQTNLQEIHAKEKIDVTIIMSKLWDLCQGQFKKVLKPMLILQDIQ